jgi:hypothetical protein
LADCGHRGLPSGLPFSIIDKPGQRRHPAREFQPELFGRRLYSGRRFAAFERILQPAAFVRSCPIGTVVGGVFLACSNSGVGAVNNPSFDSANPFGNTQRNAFTGPGQKNVDLSLIKFIPFTERIRGEFRIEAFNIFN